MTCRNSRGRFDRPEITAPLIVRKAKSARSAAVAKGNRTRASKWRRACLAKFGVTM
jgi:hypothetical protein